MVSVFLICLWLRGYVTKVTLSTYSFSGSDFCIKVLHFPASLTMWVYLSYDHMKLGRTIVGPLVVSYGYSIRAGKPQTVL